MTGPNSPRASDLTRRLQQFAYDQCEEGAEVIYLFSAAVNLTAAVYLTCYKNTEGDEPGAQAARDALHTIGVENLRRLGQLINSANPIILADAIGIVTKADTVAMKNGRFIRNPEPPT